MQAMDEEKTLKYRESSTTDTPHNSVGSQGRGRNGKVCVDDIVKQAKLIEASVT
jgi:hypothetical protein